MVTVLPDGCVLIPHLLDWRIAPEPTRKWQTGIATGLTLGEDRQALRQTPLHGLKWTVMPFDARENQRLTAAIRRALRVGNAAVPWWGRCLVVGAAGVGVGDTTIAIAGFVPAAWLPAVGDQLWACGQRWATDGGAAWELWTVSAVTPGESGAEHTIEIGAPAARPIAGGAAAVWPLLRGQFSAAAIEYDRPTVGPQTLTVQQPLGLFAIPGRTGPSISASLARWGRVGPEDPTSYVFDGWWMSPDVVMLNGLPSAETVERFDRPGGYAFSTIHGTTLAVSTNTTSRAVGAVPWSTTAAFDQFNPTAGRIDHITLEVTNALRSTPRAENLDSSSADLTVGSTSTVTVRDPSVVTLVAAAATVTQTVTVTAYDGVTDYAGPGGGPGSGFVIDPGPSASHSESLTLTDSDATFAQFIGTGTISLAIGATGSPIATGSPTISSIITTEAGATITLQYHYHRNEGYVWLAVPDWSDWAPRPGDGVTRLSDGSIFPMATAADLGVSTEKNGFGRVLVSDIFGDTYWMYRSRDVVCSGDDDALVVVTNDLP